MLSTLSRRWFLKHATVVGAATFAAGWVAGCAPKETPAPAQKPAEGPVSQEETAAPAPKGTLEIRFMDRGDAIGEASRHFSRVFEEQNPGVVVKNESTSWADLTTKVQTMVAADTMADVAFQHGALMIPELGAKGVWMDIEPLGDRDGIDWDIYWPWALNSLRLGPKGELVAGPESSHLGPNVIGYNKELLEEMGFGVPSTDMTVPDFVDLLTKVQSMMPEGGFAICTNADEWFLEGLSRNYSGHIISQDRESCGFSMEKTQEAHKFQYDLVNTYKVMPGRDQILKDMKSMFYSGMVAMIVDSPNNIWTGFTAGTEGRFHLGSSQLPHGGGLKHGTTPSCNAYVIYGKTDKADLAWSLVRMLTSNEAAKWMALQFQIGPGAVIEAWHDPEVWAANPIYEDCAKAWSEIPVEEFGNIPVPTNARRAEFHDLFNNEWQAMLYGDKPYNQANVDKLQADLQAIMDKPMP